MMKKISILLLSLSFSFFTACGDDSSSASNSEYYTSSEEGADVPSKTEVKITGVEKVSDSKVSKELEEAETNIKDILINIKNGDFSDAQAVSSKTKKTFKDVLKKHPENGEAQLGYALTIVTDLVNNPEINGFVETVSNHRSNILDLGTDDFNHIMVSADGKLLTSEIQKAMASAIPSLDSAILYIKNIVKNENFTCTFSIDDRDIEINNVIFASFLGSLYIAKAVLVFGASINIDFSDNGSYNWLDELDKFNPDMDTLSSNSFNHITKLLHKGSSLSSIYKKWIPSYKNIPQLLDSSVLFIKMSMEYGIKISKNGSKSQANNLFVIGDDEMSDISPAHLNKVIDSLDYYREALKNGVEITLNHGTKIKVNIKKFFEITDGFQQFFPYHVINDQADWNVPVEGYDWESWEDKHILERAYAQFEIKRHIKEQLDTSITNDKHFYIDVEKGIYIGTSEYGYGSFEISMSNCEISFNKLSWYENEDFEESLLTISPLKISEKNCKVEDGEVLFATGKIYNRENFITFTDKNGKPTISLQGLYNGKVDKYDELKELIIFPDYTFGGVFPDMTKDKLWKLIEKEIDF